MNALPVISLDGSTVARTRRVLVTSAFGRPVAQPFEFAWTEWVRPSATRGSGHVSTRSYCPEVVL